MTEFPGRLPELAEDEWSEEVSGLLQSTLGPVGEMEGGASAPARRPLPILGVIAHQDRLLAPFLAWASAIALEGVLSRRDSELLALRVAHNCVSDFEWRHHAVFARAAAMTDDEIANIAVGPSAVGWAAHEVALLRAADELHSTTNIGAETWAELAAYYQPAALVEIIFVVGQYTMLSMLANAAGVVDDDNGADRQPEKEAG
jgi:4-carboxymuconolactone decarboxylase